MSDSTYNSLSRTVLQGNTLGVMGTEAPDGMREDNMAPQRPMPMYADAVEGNDFAGIYRRTAMQRRWGGGPVEAALATYEPVSGFGGYMSRRGFRGFGNPCSPFDDDFDLSNCGTAITTALPDVITGGGSTAAPPDPGGAIVMPPGTNCPVAYQTPTGSCMCPSGWNTPTGGCYYPDPKKPGQGFRTDPQNCPYGANADSTCKPKPAGSGGTVAAKPPPGGGPPGGAPPKQAGIPLPLMLVGGALLLGGGFMLYEAHKKKQRAKMAANRRRWGRLWAAVTTAAVTTAAVTTAAVTTAAVTTAAVTTAAGAGVVATGRAGTAADGTATGGTRRSSTRRSPRSSTSWTSEIRVK